MASSSISSNHKSFKYDLFLSFRGEDTRTNFVDHLYHALQRQGIHTFKDDKRLEKGKRIDDELIKAIEDSRLFIIVFSKNYASSSWCHKTTEQAAYPVFYDVEPTEVRKQSGVFGEAFAKHKFKDSFGKWREVLKEAADLCGWELKKTADGHEAAFITQIVEKIYLELCSINFSVDENLVGMENRIKDVELLLETGYDDVRMIGIKGMGGGGKTTLARSVFDKLSFHFEGKSFVENVREVSQASLTGLKSLQEQILSDVLKDKNINVNSVYDGKNMIKKMLSSRKVLLVLDDVDHLNQLEALACEPSWFMAGSRIIVTTRDEQVLVAHGVELIHNVNLLSDDEATCLFSRYAFGRDTPIQGYEDLSLEAVIYVAGLPLATKVLGSFLCGKDELEWIDALERLKTIPNEETTKILELSYMGLANDWKELFLNVACFMKAWKKDDVIHALECCGFHARTGLKVLEQKSLLTIFQDNLGVEHIDVHDLIEEMGIHIVRGLHPDDPSTHSRLWIPEEIEDILANGLGTQATKYINLRHVGLGRETFMNGFRNMEKLIFLNVEDVEVVMNSLMYEGCPFEDESSSNYMKIDQVRQYFPNSLRYLQWDGYPHWCLPKSFRANNLVGLRTRDSRIEQLWEKGERKVMKNLKFLDFSFSKLKTLDLEMTPNLEKLDLIGCHYLEKLVLPSGDHLKLKSLWLSKSRLRTIDIRQALNLEMLKIQECEYLVKFQMPVQCVKLRSLQLTQVKLGTLDLRMAQNLETLDLYECDLVKLHLPDKCLKLTSLHLCYLLKMKELNLGLTANLETFCIKGCDDLVKFHMPLECLKLKSLILSILNLRTLDLQAAQNLETLDLFECHNLVKLHLHENYTKLTSLGLSCLSMLRELNLGLTLNLETFYFEKCNGLVDVQALINRCQNLKTLHIIDSNLKTLNLGLAPILKKLHLERCHKLLVLHIPVGCPTLEYIEITDSKLRTLDLGLTPNLKKLSISKCYDLENFDMPNVCPKLSEFHLNHSKLRTLDLQLAPNLDNLKLEDCDELVELHMPVNGCSKLRCLYLENLKLGTLQLTPNLASLHLENCDKLVELHMPVNGCSKLKQMYLRHLKLSTLQLTPNLDYLKLENCDELVELHMPVNGCSKLTTLYLRHLKLRSLDLRLSPYLDSLEIDDCQDLAQLHMPVGCLELKYLDLRHSMLRNLDLGMAPNLERLCIEECHDLQVQHNAAVECVKGLECIDLSGCSRLKSLVLQKEFQSHMFRLSAESIDICPLDTKHSLPKLQFSCLFEECKQRSSTTINLQNLVSLAYCCFRNFMSFSKNICGLQSLRKLKLHGSIPEMPKHLEKLKYLEELVLSSIETKHLPESICMLKRLKSLKLESCSLLEKLPEDIGRLKGLEKLIVKDCTSLTHIPNGICMMKRLKVFDIAFCTRVEKLPEELGGLEYLKVLNVEGTAISQLPNSIFWLKGLRVVGSISLLRPYKR